MAGLSEQEEDLETQIETYKAQLRIVQGKVSTSSEAELAPLIADLQQLIQLSEENLLELKKQKLLLMLHKAPPPDDDRNAPNNKVKASAETTEATKAAVSRATQEDGIVGMKCRAPLKESWGGESYHNAIILSVEATPPSSDDQPSPDDPQVHLLFTQPLYPAMRPCPFFLQATCKFSEEECKFSHGHTAPLSTLQSHLQPDHSMAHVGGQCLAQHEDGLWHRGIISSVGEEEYVVHFPSLGATCTVSCEGVMPLESDSSTSSSSGSDGEEVEGEEEEVVVEWRPSAMKCALGEWERHTTGIGSKLLAKMGYIVGHGLGKEGQGRVEPVEIVILPSGKSLDVCAELREAKKVKVVDGIEKVKKRKRKKKKKVPLVDEDKKPMDMFEFLNTQIFPSDKSKKKMLELKKDSSNSPANSKNLNVKLLKIQEEMKAVHRRKKSLQESLQRHQKRKEKQLVEQVKEKIRGVDSQLEDLHRQESALQRSIATKSEHKKLAVF